MSTLNNTWQGGTKETRFEGQAWPITWRAIPLAQWRPFSTFGDGFVVRQGEN